jgi:hypothetical protein
MTSDQIKYIINKVDELKANGTKKQNAFKMVAKELNTTYATVLGRYYSYRNKDFFADEEAELQKKNELLLKKEELQQKKEQREVQKAFVNEVTLSFIKDGKKVQDALLYCADSLQITYQKARVIWESVRTNETKTRERNMDWTDEQDERLVAIVFEETGKGLGLIEACTIADSKLSKKAGGSRSRWQNKLKFIHGDKLELSTMFKWDDEKDEILKQILIEGVRNDKTLKTCFEIAAKKLNTKADTCQSRYSITIRHQKQELDLKVGIWTDEEKETLFIIMNYEIKRGKTDWDAAFVADEVLKRGHRNCLSKYSFEMKTDIRHTPRWNDEETEVLINCVNQSKTLIEGYRLASTKLEQRDFMACQTRWNQLRKEKKRAKAM